MTREREKLTRFGFSFERGGAHAARTMMFGELEALLSYVGSVQVPKADYVRAIREENCLGKRSAKTRELTSRHLASLYALDPSVILYRAFLYFWERDHAGRPLLALLCAYARDSILRSTALFFTGLPACAPVEREAVEAYIDKLEPGRYSKATLKSIAQNVNASWTQSGHLSGRVKKVRAKAVATPGSTAYALLLGYLSGVRGQALFQTEYTRLLDCTREQAVELAEQAAQKGWILFKRVGDVIEVLFPNLIEAEEMEWLREQN